MMSGTIVDNTQTNIASPDSGITAMVSGRGVPVVLVHGALGDYRQWNAVGARLRSRFRVVALSRRLHWPNAPSPAGGAYTIESHRDDLLALLGTLEEPVHLVGHSYGALVVLSAVLAAPQLVRSLVLIEPPLTGLLPVAGSGLDAELASRSAMLAAMRADIAAGADEAASVRLIDWVQAAAGGFIALPESGRAQLLANAHTIGPTYAIAPQSMTCVQLQDIRLPTLVLHGALTRTFYRLAAQAAAACIAHTRSAEIADAGHMAIIENPGATALLLRMFFADT